MTTDKCACGNDKEDWMEVCKQCYAKNKGNKPTSKNKDKEIKRQVFLKIASEQLKSQQPKDLVSYAQSLEIEFNKWA
ncbi:hypothetical protein HYT53_04555 [Candidatus Woesearchaeota archaeon]|nr:hypothetical protein [Candidatus Woesearchaeota archaeon]